MTGLRIGWATPWNERSAIADSASEVAMELTRRGHAVTVLRTEVDDAAATLPRPNPLPVVRLGALDDGALRRNFDVLVAHLGNYHSYHGAVIERLDHVDFVCVFHDAFFAHLAADFFQQFGGEPALRHLVRETYGEEAMAPEEPFWIGLEEMARRRPMLEWLARRSVAAVAHSGHYAARLGAACPGPVATIPLAFVVSDLPPPPPAWNRMTVAAIGHANPNKRLDQLLLAIGTSPILRERCRMRVIGEAAPAERERLEALAATAGAMPPEFTGWVSDEELRWQLRDVDVISCLRNPVLEGASASLVVALASGRPTLVTHHGCYAEVPPEAVMGCRPEHEALDAMRHLERLMAEPGWGEAVGRHGRTTAAERFAPAAYVDALLPMLEQVVATRPLRDARRSLLNTLLELGVGRGDPAMWRTATVLDGMGAPREKETEEA